jgi:hypothetical protein
MVRVKSDKKRSPRLTGYGAGGMVAPAFTLCTALKLRHQAWGNSFMVLIPDIDL